MTEMDKALAGLDLARSDLAFAQTRHQVVRAMNRITYWKGIIERLAHQEAA